MLSQCPKEKAYQLALTAGDDYELCFTAPKVRQPLLYEIANSLDITISHIGEVHSGMGFTVINEKGQSISLKKKGYQAFQ